MAGNIRVRASAIFARTAIESYVLRSPYEYYHLKKLLKRHYNCYIELHTERVIYSSPHHTIPHIYGLRLELRLFANPRQVSNICIYVKAKILGLVPKEEREKQKIVFGFEREMVMYKYVIPTLMGMQEAWQPSSPYQYCDLFPMFYGASISLVNPHARKLDHTAAIVTENLRDCCYTHFKTLCDYRTAEVVVQRLAYLHGLPLAMSVQEQLPYVTRIANMLIKVNQYKDILDPDVEYNRICNALSTEDLNRYKPDILRHLNLYANNDHRNNITDNPLWRTICHTKCSILHMCYRTDRILSLSSIKMTHLEAIEMDSCCSDLIYFLFTSTTSQVLETHFYYIVARYFAELQRIMGSLLILMQHSYQEFLDELHLRAYVNIGRVLFDIGLIHSTRANIDDPESAVTEYNNQILGVIKCMINNNWLKETQE